LAAAGHVEDALKLFDEMSEAETQPMPVTFAIMVRVLARAGMTERLLEMIGVTAPLLIRGLTCLF
ncbi:hypothetical protein BAE44_0019732, partial [Dichanthelium oligosanthes]